MAAPAARAALGFSAQDAVTPTPAGVGVMLTEKNQVTARTRAILLVLTRKMKLDLANRVSACERWPGNAKFSVGG